MRDETVPGLSSPESMTGVAPARSLAPEHYCGAEALARDQRLVFERTWQLLGHVRQLVDTGQHIAATIGRTPVLVVRGGDGIFRAFANVCRHRAGPLVLSGGRGSRALRCRYHGWTYDLEGRLRHAPEMGDAADFRPEEGCLPRFRAGAWQGLVFVSLDDRVPALEDVLSGIVQRIAPIDLAAMAFAHRDTYTIECNWKVYVDNYLEGYHLPYVHPGLSGILDYRRYQTDLFAWHSLQHSPVSAGEELYGNGEAFYYFVYPNLMLNVLPGRLQVNRVLPAGPERCIVEFDYYYAREGYTPEAMQRDRAFSEEIQQEDIGICEAVQRGLASGNYEPGRLNPRRESGVWHFHQLLRRAYGAQPGDAS